MAGRGGDILDELPVLAAEADKAGRDVTDIEVSMVRWFSCGPFSTQSEEQSEVCKRKL